MKIVTTPMCKDVLMLAGVSEFEVNSHPDSTDADIAVVLSETGTTMKSVKVKLNTFLQIENSIQLLSKIFESEPVDHDVDVTFYSRARTLENRKIKVKVCSNFLKDIIDDLGVTSVDGMNFEDQDYNYLVYPDYMGDTLSDEIVRMGELAIKVPSHKNAPKDPFKRAEMRYKLLEKKLCMKL